MARMVEESLVIKVSRLVKDNEDSTVIFTSESLVQLEAVLDELVNDPKSVIEVVFAQD